ncbi:glycosyltransferase family 4 protein [uncultured Jatrophihabitans sp.]|uniref:glycosyltransferase family 4 protein n=1 Tax=uncultured Jatrophihabitans sp. TaxID=1610747 RepID=UPI0035CB28DF
MTAPLRVLEVAPRYFPDLGGTESHVHEVTTRMVHEPDLELTVLATDRSGRLPRTERADEGFDIVRRRAYPQSRDYYLAPGIARVITRGDWDLVHFQGVHTFVPIVGMAAAARAGVPYVLTFHTGGHSAPSRTAIRDTQWRALTPLLRRARRLIAVSRYERTRFEQATGIDASHFTVIRNGGSLPELTEPVSPVPGRIVSSGRLERYKGHHRVIEALPLLRQSDPDAHLVILGGGPYEGELRALADRCGVAEHVQIRQVDPRDRGAMARELAGAQVLAALSDYEAHPVAVMEGLTLGVPVVGFDVAGIGDLVEDGLVTGLPITAGAGQVAAAVATAMRGPRGDNLAATDFPTWDACARQLSEVYRAEARRPGA